MTRQQRANFFSFISCNDTYRTSSLIVIFFFFYHHFTISTISFGRFGAGPETMTSDDYQTLHDVRRNIWTSGFKGFMMGGIIGAVGSTLYPYLQNPLKLSFIMEPKHRTGAVLGLSALGMLLGVSTTGQENSWRMTNIYSRGATSILSRYQKLMAGKALDKEEDEAEGTWGMGIINAARNSRDGTNVATTLYTYFDFCK